MAARTGRLQRPPVPAHESELILLSIYGTYVAVPKRQQVHARHVSNWKLFLASQRQRRLLAGARDSRHVVVGRTAGWLDHHW